MARQGKGIFDSFSGNIGDIQGSKYGTLGVIKSKNKKSVKTQTQALIKTKTDFELANEIYLQVLASPMSVFFEKSWKNQTAKNYFIGKLLMLLNVKTTQSFQFPLFPGSIAYDRMRPYPPTGSTSWNWGFYQNQSPRLSIANDQDRRCTIRLNEPTDLLVVSTDGAYGIRGTGQGGNNWRVPYPRVGRRIYILFFRDQFYNHVFNCYATAGPGL